MVLLCEKPGAGATRSLRENTSGENSVMTNRAVQGGTQDNPVGESLKPHRRISSIDDFPQGHPPPCIDVIGQKDQDISSCLPP